MQASGSARMGTLSAIRPRIPLWTPLVLSLPAFFPLLWTALRAWRHGLIPTAFIQYDVPYYLANARQHFTQGFHVTYGNPYAPYGTPAIYFQPHILLLGILQRIGLGPDLAWIAFHIAAVAFASIVAARVYEHWVGWGTRARQIGLVCFFWGGGVLSILGGVFGLFTHLTPARSFVLFDAGDGWWMFNFGRNLVIPTEAYYHGLFLLCILLLARRRFGWALAFAAVLCASHPFTGLSLVLILTAFSALELLLSSGAASLRFLIGSVALAALHLAYYTLFLNRFADHRALAAQWKLDWPYLFWTFAPALYLVAIFAFVPLTRWKKLAAVAAEPRNRLCLVWFAVICALTHHDLVIAPRQPIHFAHGYDWIALFLLGAPAIIGAIERMLAIRWRPAAALAVACFVALFLSDNLFWFATFTDRTVQWQAFALTPDQKDVLDWLAHHASSPAYVASSDQEINYLTPTYTGLRAWRGHDFNTPHVALRQGELDAAFSSGKPIRTSNPVFYIPRRNQRWTPPEGASRVYSNRTYEIIFLRSRS